MERNLLAYYRQSPGKLDSQIKLNTFLYSTMLFTGVLGSLVAIVMQMISTLLSAIAAGGEVSRPYPVSLNLVVTLFVAMVCIWGAGLCVGAINRLQTVRDWLEEQGAVSTKRPDTMRIYFLGVPAGAAIGGILAV